MINVAGYSLKKIAVMAELLRNVDFCLNFSYYVIKMSRNDKD